MHPSLARLFPGAAVLDGLARGIVSKAVRTVVPPLLLSGFVLSAIAPAQNAKLSVVSGMKPGDVLHIGVSTPDPQMDRAQILVSIGSSAPWTYQGVQIVLSPGGFAILATKSPQACLPPDSSTVGFGFDAHLPLNMPSGVEIHLQSIVWSSVQPQHRTISDGIVVSTLPMGSALARWGVQVLTSALQLQRLDVDALSLSAPLAAPWPTGPAGNQLTLLALTTPPVVSSDDFSAAIPVDLNDPFAVGGVRTAVYVLRNIRAQSAAQATGYWLPLIDPGLASPGYSILGAPAFNSDPQHADELWVLETPNFMHANGAYRLARYQLGPASAQFLGASNLSDPQQPNAHLSAFHWLVRAGQAVFLEQDGDSGLELVRYTMGGTVASRFSVDPNGFAGYHAVFDGIVEVPQHPSWGLVQYGTGGPPHARVIDVITGQMSEPLAVGNRFARMATDGSWALFEAPGPPSGALLPVKLTQPVSGQPLQLLPTVASYFCSGDSVATDGSTVVSAPYGCATTGVHRARLDATGQLEIANLCATTGFGPFFNFYDTSGTAPLAFRIPGRNAVLNLTGSGQDGLQLLDATTMTYGSITLGMVATYFF